MPTRHVPATVRFLAVAGPTIALTALVGAPTFAEDAQPVVGFDASTHYARPAPSA